MRAERLLGGLAGLGVDVEQDDVAAGGEDGFGGRAPQPRRAAGDDECLAGNLHDLDRRDEVSIT